MTMNPEVDGSTARDDVATDTAQVAQLLGLSAMADEDGHLAQSVPKLDAQVGRRARAARQRAGLDAATVARSVGLSADKLSKIENGKRRISPRELPVLAHALHVSMASLLGAADGSRPALALAHRVSAAAGESATVGARARAVELLEAEDRLTRRTEMPARRLSPAGSAIAALVSQQYAGTPRTKAEAVRQGRALAEEVRRQLDLGIADIGDLAALIELHFAADVALSPLGPGSDGLCAHDGNSALLVVNTDFPLGRTRFTLAHELGHHLLDDAHEVIEESLDDMNTGTFLERRVNSFAAHLLLPVKAIRATMAWLSATSDDIEAVTPRGQMAIGYLMVRYGVSMPCVLGQLVDASFLDPTGKEDLVGDLSAARLVATAAPLAGDKPGPERTMRELRPPARLATVVIEAVRSGVVGMNTVAVVLGRPDDDELLDEVMYGVDAPALS